MIDREDPTDASCDEEHIVTAILDSIEKRWAKADQDLHIGAFFLNPYLNAKLLNPTCLSPAVLMGVLRRLYERLFQASEVPANFMDSVYKYHRRTGLFLPDNWPVKELEKGFQKTVRINSDLHIQSSNRTIIIGGCFRST